TALCGGSGLCFLKVSNFVSGYRSVALPSTSFIKVGGARRGVRAGAVRVGAVVGVVPAQPEVRRRVPQRAGEPDDGGGEAAGGDREGKKQFRMEVATISSTHHLNLVRLISFCSEGRHRLLAYEFMKNGSLDAFLFTDAPGCKMSWPTRFAVAVGTARGITYLHEKCRDCIVHCNIKPENILLDEHHNAKVFDSAATASHASTLLKSARRSSLGGGGEMRRSPGTLMAAAPPSTKERKMRRGGEREEQRANESDENFLHSDLMPLLPNTTKVLRGEENSVAYAMDRKWNFFCAIFWYHFLSCAMDRIFSLLLEIIQLESC
uniref:non-specific serine/threonine protein kinase n=1 Tax=Oryza glaberrima TaxID=4538 RepID=I1QA42_ORYGL